MRRWTLYDEEYGCRADLGIVESGDKHEAALRLASMIQDGDEFTTWKVINDTIYGFSTGCGYLGGEWNCDDSREEMWDASKSCREFSVEELADASKAWVNGTPYDLDTIEDSFDIIHEIDRATFHRKFPDASTYGDEFGDIDGYLENGAVLFGQDCDDCGSYKIDNYQRYCPVYKATDYDENGEAAELQPIGYVVGY